MGHCDRQTDGNQIRIVREADAENPFIIVEKPHDMPTAMLAEYDVANATALVVERHPELRNIECRAKFDFGLLNRLDFGTRGILLFATTQAAYDFFRSEQKLGRIRKFYEAICDERRNDLPGMPQMDLDVSRLPLEVSTFFRSFGKNAKEVRPCLVANRRKNGTEKKYSTRILSIKRGETGKIVECEITSGFRHQIRTHLCMVGFPIKGDALYNPKSNLTTLQLVAREIEFRHPISRQAIRVSLG